MVITFYLRLNRLLLFGVLTKPLGIDFNVKMADVANNGILDHLGQMFTADHAFAACGSHKDAGTLRNGLFQGRHFVT